MPLSFASRRAAAMSSLGSRIVTGRSSLFCLACERTSANESVLLSRMAARRSASTDARCFSHQAASCLSLLNAGMTSFLAGMILGSSFDKIVLLDPPIRIPSGNGADSLIAHVNTTTTTRRELVDPPAGTPGQSALPEARRTRRPGGCDEPEADPRRSAAGR